MRFGNQIVTGMAALRVIAGTIEICAALLMIRLNRVDSALRINASLGLIGPVIFLLVSTLGVLGIAARVEPTKLLVIAAGILLVVIGTTR